ncbi:MAG: glycosyltransferase [Bacteroidota bacterium]
MSKNTPGSIYKRKTPVRVLVAPLDWGLGHASRCIPIIKMLLAKGCEVIIATDGLQELLLVDEFPSVTFIKLKGYEVGYSKKRLMWRLVQQLGKIKTAIKVENLWLQDIIGTHKIDWVISDNRYGLYSKLAPCTLITHQLQLKIPGDFSWSRQFVQSLLYRLINKFDMCWVPDSAASGLSGVLGHPLKMPFIPTRYIGWLSRFSASNTVKYRPGKCLVILSGPEPQRTLLENILLLQLKEEKREIVIVRGLPGNKEKLDLPMNIEVFDHLPSFEMLPEFQNAEFVISRTGYSTLMDAFSLQKKCILIPTPGQTEQEYLGKELEKKKMAVICQQRDFNFQFALAKAANFDFQFIEAGQGNLLEKTIDTFLNANFSGQGV